MNERLRQEMANISFSENAKERMLAAMKQAAETKKTGKTAVGAKIMRYHIRRAAAIASIIAAILLAGTNHTVQAVIVDLFEKITMNINHNDEMHMSKLSTPMNYKETINGYTMEIYRAAASSKMLEFEVSITRPDGKPVQDRNELVVADVGFSHKGELESIGYSTSFIPCGSDSDHWLLLIELHDQEDTSFNFEEYEGTPQEVVLRCATSEQYMQQSELAAQDQELPYVIKNPDEMYMKFTVPFTLEHVFHDKSYPIDKVLRCQDYSVHVIELIDTGLFYKVVMEYTSSSLPPHQILMTELYKEEEMLTPLGGNGYDLEEQPEITRMYDYYDKGQSDNGTIKIQAVLYTYPEDGKAETQRGESVTVHVSPP